MTVDEFLAKFKQSLELELEYFDEEKDPPNLTRDKFLLIIGLIKLEDLTVKFAKRETIKGLHSLTGEEEVFHLNFEVYIAFKRRKVAYYCKGYFFDKGDLKGVFIHSFRES